MDKNLKKKYRERILPRRLVVKCGTENLCSQDGKKELNQKIFNDYARQVAELQKQGVEVIIISSGAIKAGREELEDLGLDTKDVDRQVLAAIGQPLLMKRWEEAFRKFGRTSGQLLLTFTNWSNERERNEVVQCIFDLLKIGQIPIINENDPVSDKEIKLMERRISENDQLAKMTALKIGADAILFLTDEGGIYTADPKIDPKAQLYEEVNARDIPRGLTCLSEDTPDKSGIGGMAAKIKEALRCAKRGLRVTIAGYEEDVILKFTKGKPVGTKIGRVTRLKKK
ncbi:glutamate 5-kinase [Patescibacteria group bacterium]|nr:glutamate 5-kinase [Patescibacteria group bacterium]